MKQEVDQSQVWSRTKSWTYTNTKTKQFLIHLLFRYTEILKFNHYENLIYIYDSTSNPSVFTIFLTNFFQLWTIQENTQGQEK